MEMKTSLVSKLAAFLIDNKKASTMEEALDIVFNSKTYTKIMDDKTQLYHQSPRYVYSFLEEEINT